LMPLDHSRPRWPAGPMLLRRRAFPLTYLNESFHQGTRPRPLRQVRYPRSRPRRSAPIPNENRSSWALYKRASRDMLRYGITAART